MERNVSDRERIQKAVNAQSWRQAVRRSKANKKSKGAEINNKKLGGVMSSKKPSSFSKTTFFFSIVAAGLAVSIEEFFDLELCWTVALAIVFGFIASYISLRIDYPELFK